MRERNEEMIDEKKLIEEIEKWQEALSPETTAIDGIIYVVLNTVIDIIIDMDKVEEEEAK